MVASSGAVILGGRTSLDLAWQTKTWRFYSAPDGTTAAGVRSNQGAIGEVRFVIGWIAQQIGRVQWHVDVDGRRLNDKEADELMQQVSNPEMTIAIATNQIVAGEMNYIALPGSKIEEITEAKWEALAGLDLPGDDDRRWFTVSVIDNKRKELLEAANGSGLNLRAIWAHPAKPTVADPPLKGVVDVMDEIEQLQDLAYSQNRSRIAQMGILTVANEFDLAVPGGDFGKRLEDAINAPVADPRRTGAQPILIRGPFELMTGSLSNGARGVQWTKPEHQFDDRLDAKMQFQIQRLAWGFPVAPEILLGMTATNRAVAFQIEESTYRSHVEPIARIVGRVYARALKMIMDKESARVEVTPDATDLLARRHSVADAKDLYDRGLVRAEFVRRVAGIDEEDAATDDDLERIQTLRKGNNPGDTREPDPSEVSGNEPVRASASIPADVQGALRGAMDMAVASAISRIGAAARTRLARQQPVPPLEIDTDGVSNRRLPSLLGPDRLASLGVDMDAAIDPAVEQVASWWREQIRGMPGEDDSVEFVATLIRKVCHDVPCGWPIVLTPTDTAERAISPLREMALESGGD